MEVGFNERTRVRSGRELWNIDSTEMIACSSGADIMNDDSHATTVYILVFARRRRRIQRRVANALGVCQEFGRHRVSS